MTAHGATRRVRAWAAVCAGLFMIGALLASAVSYRSRGAVFRVFEPTRSWVVVGRTAPPSFDVEAWLESKAEQLASFDVLIATGEDFVPVPAPHLGVNLDVKKTSQRIERFEEPPSWPVRIRRAFWPKPEWDSVRPAYSLSRQIAADWLRQLAPAFRREPRDAFLDIRGHRRVDDVPGRELDIEQTLDRLSQSNLEEGVVVELAARSIPARVQTADLLDIDVSRVLSVFETDFRKKAGRRAINIRRAAELLNGLVLAPGEVVSFNRRVGDRTERNGFTWAPVIVNDEMEPGLGGGVCQVATTLHAAAVLGGLEIVERRSHSRPSGYAPLGLDAAVIYGAVDLRIKNPYSEPILVHAFLPSKYVIRVEFLGASAPGKIEHQYAVMERHDFYRRLVEKEELSGGQYKRTQKGSYGYDVVSTVRLTRADGSRTTHRYFSKYYPVPEVFQIAPGTSEGELPELPEGATHMELAGVSGPPATEGELTAEEDPYERLPL